MMKTKDGKAGLYVFFAVYVLILMFFCTKSSPLYIFNDWFDANAYMTMGKGIVHGSVIYRDLFDHKGPLLYFIYAAGYVIDRTGFTGVFIFQLISMYLVSLFSFKTAQMYCESRFSAALAGLLVPMALVANKVYVYGRDYGGGSPDEFVSPLFVISLYLAVSLMKDGKYGEKDAPKLFWLGLCGGLIFLLKFNFFMFTVGLLLPLFVTLVFRDIKVFFVYAASAFIGFAAAFVPYGIYALATGSVKDFIEVYLSFNLAYAGGEEAFFGIPAALKNVWDYVWKLFAARDYFVLLVLLAALCGMIYSAVKDKRERLLNVSVILSFVFTLVMVGKKLMIYSLVPLMAFSLVGYAELCVFLRGRIRLLRPPRGRAAFAALSAVILFFSVINNNLVFGDLNRFKKNEDGGKTRLCQDEIAACIKNDAEGDSSLLQVLALDAGIYTRADVVPQSRFFYRPNISFTDCPDVYIGQYEDLKDGLNKYAVTDFKAEYDAEAAVKTINAYNYRKKIGNAVVENYELLTVVKGTYLQHAKTYYLYRKKY